MLREMPGFAAAVMIAIVIGIGAHAAVFYEADGEELRLIANRTVAHAADESADPFIRMRSRIDCAEKVPGFTVIVGLSEYNVELSVPVMGVRSLFEEPHADVAQALSIFDTLSVA
jgi:hypothetical protein